MLRHVVLFTWKDGTDPGDVERVSQGLGSLPGRIPEIRRYEFGPDLGLSARSYDYVLVADFDDEPSWRAYLEHPEHRAVVEERIRPILERLERIQYEV